MTQSDQPKKSVHKPKRKSVHMTLCGKGGVGKSVIARLLTEYLADRGEKPLAFDADPVNANFAAVDAFNVEKVGLIDANHEINPGLFDALVLRIVDSNRSVVLDTGAASYVPFFNYMRELDLAETLDENGYDLIFHVPLAGGPALPFTVENLKEVCLHFGKDAGVMVWLNHYWEQIERNGKTFTNWPVYRENADCIQAVFEINRMPSHTSAADFALMLRENKSFAEAVDNHSEFNILTRSRLMKVRKTMFGGMDALLGVDTSNEVEIAS